MAGGLQRTFNLLATTRNASAVDVLLPALDASDAAVRRGALKALLRRHSPRGQVEIIRRLDRWDAQERAMVRGEAAQFSTALREGLVGNDPHLAAQAFEAVSWMEDFDQIPALAALVESGRRGTLALPCRSEGERVGVRGIAELAVAALHELVDGLDDRLRALRAAGGGGDLEASRARALESLRGSLGRFESHESQELVEVLLALSRWPSDTVRGLLTDVRHPARAAAGRTLVASAHPGVFRLLLDGLADPNVPVVILKAIAARDDARFVGHLLEALAPPLKDVVAQNVRKLDRVAWLTREHPLLEVLAADQQARAVQFLLATGLSRDDKFAVLDRLVRHGKPGGRLAAARGLDEFTGADVSALVCDCAEDEDPAIQAWATGQLRHRSIPRALNVVVSQLDSPHEEVREAARQQLSEFNLARFLNVIEFLDPKLAPALGQLLVKIDVHAAELLAQEIGNPVRTRRQRAIRAAGAAGLAPLVVQALIERLDDPDVNIRREAARAMAGSGHPAALEALRQRAAQGDRHIREAAREALTRAEGAAAARPEGGSSHAAVAASAATGGVEEPA